MEKMKKIPEKWDNWDMALLVIVDDLLRRAGENEKMKRQMDFFLAAITLTKGKKVKPTETENLVFKFKENKLTVEPKTKKGKESCRGLILFIEKIVQSKNHSKVQENIGFLSFFRFIKETKIENNLLEVEFLTNT